MVAIPFQGSIQIMQCRLRPYFHPRLAAEYRSQQSKWWKLKPSSLCFSFLFLFFSFCTSKHRIIVRLCCLFPADRAFPNKQRVRFPLGLIVILPSKPPRLYPFTCVVIKQRGFKPTVCVTSCGSHLSWFQLPGGKGWEHIPRWSSVFFPKSLRSQNILKHLRAAVEVSSTNCPASPLQGMCVLACVRPAGFSCRMPFRGGSRSFSLGLFFNWHVKATESRQG